jgi:NAD(P) transhydrogenase
MSAQLIADSTKGLSVTRTNIEEVVELLGNAESVIIVPGYGEHHDRKTRQLCADLPGMAVAKAQYAISEMIQSLKAKGIKCRFGIHPVAGRMPGQVRPGCGAILIFT